jgi:subtilisin family serine protease
VRSVQVERRSTVRFTPNDPALTAPEVSPGTPDGTVLQWWIARLGLPSAWDITRGDGATVAVIDTGVDATHPDFAGKIQDSFDYDSTPGDGPAGVDEDGHGTHVSSLACGAGDNGAGIVGVGLNCKLLVFKTDFSDGSIVQALIKAADMHADAINMSFGSVVATPPPQAYVDALNYAAAHNVVLVAAAADDVVQEQGDPANVLQPTGTGPDINAGIGLSVTSADFSGGRSSFAGRGSQISLAAYGSFGELAGPRGLFGAFPANGTALERGKPGGLLGGDAVPPCDCRSVFQGDGRYAYLQGTSMAAPMVAATAALVKHFNPDLSAASVVRLLKDTASRPAGSGWSPELGWGIIDPVKALTAARTIDGRPPTSRLTGPKAPKRGVRSITLRWTGSDKARAGHVPSGIDHYEIYRSTNRGVYKRIKTTPKTTLKVRIRPGSRYRFYSIAIDKAGNREPIPAKPDLSMRAR